jgi:hypothetical protein
MRTTAKQIFLLLSCAIALVAGNVRLAHAIEGFGLGPDVDADAKMVDLAVLPTWLELFRAIALTISDSAINKRLEQESESLAPLLNKLITKPDVGVLVYATLVVNEDGDVFAPAGSILGVTGAGLEPIDALSESLRQPVLRQFVKGRLKQVYFWVKRRPNGKLIAGQIPVFANAKLVDEAAKEAVRRENLSRVIGDASSSGQEPFRLSDYWAEMEKTRLKNVSEKGFRDEITRLTNVIKAQNEEIDRRYREFQALYDDYRRNAQYQATLQNAKATLSLVEGAISLGKLLSDGKSVSSVDAPGAAKLDNQIEIQRSRTDMTLQNTRVSLESLSVKYNGILLHEEQLRTEWGKTGIPLPAKPAQPNPLEKYPLP